MDIIKWDPLQEFASLRQQMDKLMGSLFGKDAYVRQSWMPDVEVSETENEIVVRADTPGMDEKDLSVSLLGDTLILKGERKQQKEEKSKHLHRMEMAYGGFERSILLPVPVDTDKMSATLNKGVLEVHLPKSAAAKAKEIKISPRAA